MRSATTFKLILSETRLSAEATENGKQDAINTRFDQIQSQLAAQTNRVEEIKASISDDYWVKQQVWREKRATYGGILSPVRKLSILYREFIVEERSPELKINRAGDEETNLTREIISAIEDAPLFITNADSLKAMDDYGARVVEIGRPRPNEIDEHYSQLTLALNVFHADLSRAACVDLGITRS